MEYLQNGIEVSFSANGETKSDIIYIADFENAGKPGDKNSYIVANQWTFIENSNKRADILLFLNGLPICLFELKSPSREQTDTSEAYTQIRNYMQEIPSMFIYNCICVMSDQLTSKAGTITSGEDRFMEWKTKDGNMESKAFADFTTFFEGIFQKDRLLDIIKNFICFNNDGINSYKILAGYHQYFAVRKAKRGMSSPRFSQQAVLRYPFCGLKRRPQRLLQNNLSRFKFLHTVKQTLYKQIK